MSVPSHPYTKTGKLVSVIILGILTRESFAVGFVEDSKATLNLRNFYYRLNTDNTSNSTGESREWGQGFILNYASGFTEGPIGFGLDATGLLGFRLDSGGYNTKAGRDRTPGQLFPLDSDGSAEEAFSKGGLTAKAHFAKTEVRFGTLQPKLPVVTFNDTRLLPQLFKGGQITSSDIDNLTLTAGQLEHTKTRSSSDDISLRIAGADKINGKQADSNTFYYGGADYQVTPNLLVQYYYGNLEDFYKQHFFGLTHKHTIGPGTLKTDLRYFHSDSDGRNSREAGRNDGYVSSGYWTTGDADKGEVDNNTWSTLLAYTLGDHTLSTGYQQVSGSSAFPFLNQGDGATPYLITDAGQIGKFLSAGERTWLAGYSYDFSSLGAPGLKASITYLSGDNIDARDHSRREWERDFRLDYMLPSGALKGLGFTWRNGSLRGNTATTDQDENRLIISYTLPIL